MAKPVRFTVHAESSLADREIDRAEVERSLLEPDKVEAGHQGRQVVMRRYYDRALDQEMLLRIVLEETEVEIVIVTIYKTSSIKRYLGLSGD